MMMMMPRFKEKNVSKAFDDKKEEEEEEEEHEEDQHPIKRTEEWTK